MNNLWKTIHLRIDSYSLMNKNIHHYGVIDMCMNIQDKVIYLSNNRG
ncbi:XRE family transcriptional regulator, partial [Acinetobacter baumannii]|nr:XRE family transcriptional regulator [Acinetobacter baumannii]